MTIERRARAACRWQLVAALLLLIPACAAPSSRLELVSYKDPYFPESYHARFRDCTYRREPAGDLVVVARARDAAGPDAGVVTQYLRAHVFWTPRPGKTFANATTTDATLCYVVVSERGSVTYTGTAFVYPRLDERRGRLVADIESGRLRVDSVTGDAADLLGDCRLSGRIVAAENANLAMELVHEMNLHAVGQGARPSTSADAGLAGDATSGSD